MTISDLKTGMTVTCRNGERYIVLRDTAFDGKEKDILWRPGGFWMPLADYNDSLENKPDPEDDWLYIPDEEREKLDREYDIIEVQKADFVAAIGRRDYFATKVLWRRG